ncbi:PX domain-containing protein EREL1-like isoform X2 [Telopea speciosissima]|uniref:PX domain-containing protein EREL1-like isoform X2 n=1 Tax=Telopea speciosissima TaxID=54955 RepID=UPI001CC61CF1|nr:PX domain-containing protein EREL1-like isoform X2 [Telopea speciosissima]
MLGRSPPKHRHDGTSPLPLGMDWSPPPKKWDGRDTVWPHDPHTGWSYCITIPSWILLPKSRDSDPVVFYRVQVGIQSPEGITTTRAILRRFNDFLKLFTELKKGFPKKNLPPSPPKGLLRLKSRTLLEERRCFLEEWMGKLLSDIDISRSTPVASFLELEAAARSSFHDGNQHTVETNASDNSMVSVLSGSLSITSDYGSDIAYETSELGTPRHGRDNSSEIGTEDLPLDLEVANSIGTFVNFGIPSDNGLFMGDSILEQLEGFSRHKSHTRKGKSVENQDSFNGNASRVAFLSGDGMELLSEPEHGKVASHTRKLSAESVGSDISSVRGSEILNSGAPKSYGDGSLDFPGGAESRTTAEILGTTVMQFPDDVQIVLPLNQRNKMNRVLMTMQQRLTTAKTDMEDLIARLNQEMAVKDYLTTKVKDLEVELESTKQKSKENFQQAILIERERFTQTQWDMEELRRKCLEMESKLKSEQDEKVRTESTKVSAVKEKEMLMQGLDSTREQLQNLQKHHEELEMKSKADVKVLVKEVKSLRSSQSDLRQELSQLLNEKSELEKALRREKQGKEHAETASAKLLHECGILRGRLQECSINFLAEEEDKFTVDSSSLSDALDLLATSDNRIGLLVAEAQLLAQDDENPVASASKDHNVKGDDLRTKDDRVRKMLTDIFIDNARLRKQVNSVIRCALKTAVTPENDDDDGEEEPARKTVLNKFLER